MPVTSYPQQQAPAQMVRGGAAITPNDSTDLTHTTDRGIYVGTGGTVKVVTEDGSTLEYFNVPDGYLLPVVAKRVYSTVSSGTAASNMLAQW